MGRHVCLVRMYVCRQVDKYVCTPLGCADVCALLCTGVLCGQSVRQPCFLAGDGSIFSYTLYSEHGDVLLCATQVGTKNSMQASLSSMLPGLHLGPDRLPQIQLHHRLLFV